MLSIINLIRDKIYKTASYIIYKKAPSFLFSFYVATYNIVSLFLVTDIFFLIISSLLLPFGLLHHLFVQPPCCLGNIHHFHPCNLVLLPPLLPLISPFLPSCQFYFYFFSLTRSSASPQLIFCQILDFSFFSVFFFFIFLSSFLLLIFIPINVCFFTCYFLIFSFILPITFLLFFIPPMLLA